MSSSILGMLRKALGDPRKPIRPLPSSTNTPEQNFMSMRHLKTDLRVDAEGRWLKVQTRQCPYTGVVLRQTKRVTD